MVDRLSYGILALSTLLVRRSTPAVVFEFDFPALGSSANSSAIMLLTTSLSGKMFLSCVC